MQCLDYDGYSNLSPAPELVLVVVTRFLRLLAASRSFPIWVESRADLLTGLVLQIVTEGNTISWADVMLTEMLTG